MSTQPWPEQIVRRAFADWPSAYDGISPIIIRLLKAERRRAVRVCRKLAHQCVLRMLEDDSVENVAVWEDRKRGCNDCANAIGGT
jgi:hypothetical protein